MPSKDTKIVSARVPNRVNFDGISMGKLITSIYDCWRFGIIEIRDSELVIPEPEEISTERFEDIP